MRPRRNRPLFIIDIAVPRDVEPDVGSLEQVFLYNIDDLQAIVQENLARRAAELARAEAIVARGGRAVRRLDAVARDRSRPSSRCASGSRRSGESELQRLEPKLAALPPDARARVDEITHLIVEKLLLTPTEQLKSVSDERLIGRLRRRAEPAVQPGAGREAARPRAAAPSPRGAVVTRDCASARAAASSRCGRRGPSRGCIEDAGRAREIW